MNNFNKRPKLNNKISIADFKAFYWLKEELIYFCKQQGISAQGGKLEISKRIELFIQTGKVISKLKSVIKNHKLKFNWNTEQLNLKTLITDNYKNTENVRAFFTKQIGKQFAFNVQFMNWMKVNIGKTLKEAIIEWKRINKINKDKTHTTNIASQFEYNRYIRDFLKNNPGKTIKEAIKYWNIKKFLPGSHKYDKKDILIK